MFVLLFADQSFFKSSNRTDVPFLKKPKRDNYQDGQFALCLRSQIFPRFLNISDKREGGVCHDPVPTPYVDAVSRMV
jgi:hypothetical protein